MRVPRVRKASTGKQPPPPTPADGAQVVSGAEFLLSMVETHWNSRNGDARKMEVRLKAEQELARIEEQIEHLQAVPGQNEETRRQIEQLHERVEGLRRQIHSSHGAWEETELSRHPQ